MTEKEQPEKIPTGARFYYFHVDNREDVKNAWGELALQSGITVGEGDAKELVNGGFHGHGRLTSVTTIEGDKARLSISLYKNIAIISGLFFLSGGLRTVMSELSSKSLPGMDAAIGEATVLISSEREVEDLSKETGVGKLTKIETKAGLLYQFEEKEGHKEHVYILTSPPGSNGLEHLLRLNFPLFDLSIHKLHLERDYFKNQRKWVMNEKAEIDKAVGDILHKRIVGETFKPEYVEILEKEIDTLSTKYAILVNDGHLIRKARVTVEEDIEAVYNHLEDMAPSVPMEGLDILKQSIDLKKRLSEDELSISYSIRNTKTAIDTVRTNVDLLRSRETIFLQEEAVSFQVAAGVLEFIIIFYYSIASWEHLIGPGRMEVIPPPVRFTTILLFASFSVALTHFVGESFREKWKINKGMLASGAALFAVFLYIVYLSIQTGGLHPA